MFNSVMRFVLSGIFVCMLFSASFSYAGEAVFPESLAFGAGKAKPGGISVHPGLKIKGTWDDNIYNTASDKKKDYIVTVSPGLLLGAGDRYRFELGYSVDVNRYMEYMDENFVAHRGKGGISMELPSGLRLRIDDVYVKTEDPRPEERLLRASHWMNQGYSSIGFVFPAKRLGMDVSYALNYLKYDQDENESLNRRDDAVTATVSYRFLPKSSVLLEYTYAWTDYFDMDGSIAPNSVSHEIEAGFKWDPTAKLSGLLKGGWEWRVYDNDYEDAQLLSASGDLNFKASASTTLNLNLQRSLEETAYAGNFLTGYSASTHYVRTGGAAGITQKIGKPLSVELNGSYEMDEYEKLVTSMSAREDKIIGAGAEVNYKIGKWVTVRLGYSYTRNNSNDNFRDEKHNKASLSVLTVI